MQDKVDQVITPQNLELSEGYIDRREIANGFALINSLLNAASSAHPDTIHMDRFVANAALWMDTGWGGIERFRSAQRFASGKSATPFEFGCRSFALAIYEFAREDVPNATRHFQRSLEIFEEEDRVDGSKFYLNLCCFYLARCERRRGSYKSASKLMQRAMDLARERKALGLWAVIGYNMSRMLMQQGDKRGLDLLNECGDIIKYTDDGTAKAAIQSILGRAARRQGHYHEAVERAGLAVTIYDQYHKNHSSAARYRVDLAAAQRLLSRRRAAELSNLDHEKKWVSETKQEILKKLVAIKGGLGAEVKNLDHWGLKSLESIVNKKAADEVDARREQQRERLKKAISDLRRAATANLNEAEDIYDVLANDKGRGLVAVYTGFLAIDESNWDLALQHARRAVELGIGIRNSVLQLRAHVMWSIGAKACADDEVQLADFDHVAARHHADEAIRVGPEAAHNRLLARAHIALADVLTSPCFHNFDDARKQCRAAEKLFEPGDRDWVTEALTEVRAKILLSENSDWDHLRIELDEAVANGAPIKDLEDRCRAYFVVRVWREEGCKIERVKKRLHMNDQEIRAILKERGLWGGGLPQAS